MNVEQMPDPVLRALSSLRPTTPSKTHDDRVRARCHDALARRRRFRKARPQALDVALAAAVALYVAIGVSEAARLVFGSG
jgi:hypothetical protein